MTTIVLVGAAGAVLVVAIIAKVLTRKPRKAEKWERAQIVKRLVALSENEDREGLRRQTASPRPALHRRAAAGQGASSSSH